jgi:hypothetical protein
MFDWAEGSAAFLEIAVAFTYAISANISVITKEVECEVGGGNRRARHGRRVFEVADSLAC